MQINATVRLLATQTSYLSLEFIEALRYWVMPRQPNNKNIANDDWGLRLAAYKVIAASGLPSKYKQGGTMYRGITIAFQDYLRLNGKYPSKTPSSWTTEPIKRTQRGIGFGTKNQYLNNMKKVKTAADVPEDQQEFARVFVVFEKNVPSSTVVININSLFTDPEYKAQLKTALGSQVNLTEKVFRSGWMNEVIVKPDSTLTQADVLFENFFIVGRPDADIKKFQQQMRSS